jgi:DNA-binding CsgD family transcriptional regulator
MKKDFEIQPLHFQEFTQSLKVSRERKRDYQKVFRKDIENIPKYAIGPYFWFIPDNSKMTIVGFSDNIHELTNFDKDEWKQYEPDFLSKIMHEEDWIYFLGGVKYMLQFLEKTPVSERKNYRFNIYARIKNTKSEYRWMVVQFPKIIFNKEGRGLSSLIVVSDLSHFSIVNQPVMTMIDTTNTKKPFYKEIVEKNDAPVNTANITKREREILALMIIGKNSPEIAEKLFISYHTVGNHKKKLREKTASKTSAELIYYVLHHNIL